MFRKYVYGALTRNILCVVYEVFYKLTIWRHNMNGRRILLDAKQGIENYKFPSGRTTGEVIHGGGGEGGWARANI